MRRSDFDRRMSEPIIGETAGMAFRPQSSHRPSASLIRASSTLNLRSLFGLMMFQSGCSDDLPQYCACDDLGCTPLPQPYSTSPSASCAVFVHNRQVWLGFLPTGKYHNWITTVIRLAGYTNQDEIFDGGPTGICPSCGNIGSWASLPPEGVESGDTMTGGISWWNAGGFSTDNCEGVLNIQSNISMLGGYNTTYNIWGPNSNSVAFTAVQSYYIINDPPGGTPENPGWGMSLP